MGSSWRFVKLEPIWRDDSSWDNLILSMPLNSWYSLFATKLLAPLLEGPVTWAALKVDFQGLEGECIVEIWKEIGNPNRLLFFSISSSSLPYSISSSSLAALLHQPSSFGLLTALILHQLIHFATGRFSDSSSSALQAVESSQSTHFDSLNLNLEDLDMDDGVEDNIDEGNVNDRVQENPLFEVSEAPHDAAAEDNICGNYGGDWSAWHY
ncbi:uncharacterized protein LOC116206159 [Punica granatum]|uniref:Uncharacterized protein LOC116206159 n=2 Tax=Punica granatum TaxID=22663 RepID=A0A6P8DE08_PUNGR|nr:uncharacterized protein LOC116206159 [Punica granatum]